MNEPVEIVFRGGVSNKLVFLIKGRHFPEDKDFWNANWMLVDVAIEIGAFYGKVSGEFRNEHFHDFYQALKLLYETLKGKATFHVDQRVTMNVEALSRGHIHIYGSIDDSAGNTLNFTMTPDQTYLTIPLQQLHEFVELYPVLYSTK